LQSPFFREISQKKGLFLSPIDSDEGGFFTALLPQLFRGYGPGARDAAPGGEAGVLSFAD